MDKDPKIYLINKKINSELIDCKGKQVYSVDFSDYKEIEKILRKSQIKKIKIYDITTGQKKGKIFSVNDHVNRIGTNPFIGQQERFGIDFINIEKLYTQKKMGIITNSCGSKGLLGDFPSTYLANIATMAQVLEFKIEAYLINI